MIWIEETGWKLESIVNFSLNVASFLLTLVLRRWYVVGAYVPPNNASAVYGMEQDLEAAQRRLEAILLGDINVCLQ